MILIFCCFRIKSDFSFPFKASLATDCCRVFFSGLDYFVDYSKIPYNITIIHHLVDFFSNSLRIFHIHFLKLSSKSYQLFFITLYLLHAV